MSTANRIPFRIRIGVTGHRKLSDPASLSRRIFAILEKRYQEAFTPAAQAALAAATATPVAFTIVSPLAEGADRLVAQAGLRFSGCRLEVILPLDRPEYEHDFELAASKAEFADLLVQAHRVVGPERDAEPGARDTSGSRNYGYRRAGERVVAACDILITVWDGEPSRGRGGTAEIVKYALAGKKPVFVVSTKGPEHDESHNLGILAADSVTKLNDFNAWPVSEDEIQAYCANEFGYLYGHPEAAAVPESFRVNVRDKLIPFYARASVIATAHQKAYQRTGLWGYLLAVLSVMVLAAATVLPRDYNISTWMYGIEMLLLGFLSYTIHRAGRRKVHHRWLENRALAERIRCAFYFVSCGIGSGGRSAAGVADSLSANDEVAWVDAAFREISAALPEPSLPAKLNISALSRYVRVCWVEDQIAYHRKNVEGNAHGKTIIKRAGTEKMNRRLKKLGKGLFFAAIAASAIHIGMSSGEHPHGWLLFFEEMVTVVAITLPAAGAAVNGYRTLMEFSRITSRSEAMQRQLRDLVDRLHSISTQEDLQRALARTEELMLSETRDWARLMSFADLENVA